MNCKIQIPAGRFADESNDCTVRAVTLASGLAYPVVHHAFAWDAHRKNGHGVVLRKVLYDVTQALHIRCKLVKSGGSLGKFVAQHPSGRYVITVRAHAFAVVNGTVLDMSAQSPFRHVKRAWEID